LIALAIIIVPIRFQNLQLEMGREDAATAHFGAARRGAIAAVCRILRRILGPLEIQSSRAVQLFAAAIHGDYGVLFVGIFRISSGKVYMPLFWGQQKKCVCFSGQ